MFRYVLKFWHLKVSLKVLTKKVLIKQKLKVIELNVVSSAAAITWQCVGGETSMTPCGHSTKQHPSLI